MLHQSVNIIRNCYQLRIHIWYCAVNCRLHLWARYIWCNESMIARITFTVHKHGYSVLVVNVTVFSEWCILRYLLI